MMGTSELDRAVVYLTRRNEKGISPLGSGVCVGTDLILTARHVLIPGNAGQLLDKEEIRFGNIPGHRDNTVKVKNIIEFEDIQVDVILLKTKIQLQMPIIPCAPELRPTSADQVELIGYKGDSIAQVLCRVSHQDGGTGSYAFSPYQARGMSGGAILLRNKLVGLIHARDQDQNSGYMIALADCKEFITAHIKNNKKNEWGSRQESTSRETIIKNQTDEIRKILNKEERILKYLIDSIEISSADKKNMEKVALCYVKSLCDVHDMEQLESALNTYVRPMLARVMEQNAYDSELSDRIESLFGCVIAVISADHLQTGKIACMEASKLPVETEYMVESHDANSLGQAPQFEYGEWDRDIHGKYAHQYTGKESGWKPEDAIETIALDLNKGIHKSNPNQKISDPRKASFFRRLDADLRSAIAVGKNHYLSVNISEHNDGHPLRDSKLVRKILDDEFLPELRIYHYGEDFTDFEIKIGAAIKGFYHDLTEYQAKATK